MDDNILFKVHNAEAVKYADSDMAHARLHQMIKSFAGIALDLFEDHSLIETAKAQLKEQTE